MKKFLILMALSIQSLFVVQAQAAELKRSDILRELPALIDLSIATEKNWNKSLVLDKTSLKLEDVSAATKFFNDMFFADLGFTQLNVVAEFKDIEYNLVYILNCPISIYLNAKSNDNYEISFVGQSLFLNNENCFFKAKEDDEDKMLIFNSMAMPVLKVQTWVQI